ncbi:FUSC family protein [Gordonia liuliyuniae]|uniref:FUSC family protein n=1 Tax=Gordonia liuliyuniae TaxID=2911517 RepID=A0ABS9IQ42_9ACTN|nr:FUSC family protein [Gordonia liuliyuniae]MCF8587652.1 FUSC family protein [Gordonia liuliyuniae]
MSHTPAASAPRTAERRTRQRVDEWLNRFVASDPGLTRLRTAVQTVVSVAAVIGAEWIFVQFAHPLMVSGDSAAVAAENRAAGVMGMMVVMVSNFAGPMFTTVRDGVVGLALLPCAMFVGVVAGLALADVRVVALLVMIATLGGAGFLRRFGAWGFVLGQGLFMGNFLGFFLGRLTDVSGVGWIGAELVIGGTVAILAQLVLFYPSRWSAVKRLRSSFLGRADGVAAATVDVLDHPGSPRYRERQHKKLVRLNETALMIDAQLAENPRLPIGTTAAEIHRHVFAAELALANAARFARSIAVSDTPDSVTRLVRDSMVAIEHRAPEPVDRIGRTLREALRDDEIRSGIDDDVLVVLHRFATSVIDYARVLAAISRQRFESYLKRVRSHEVAEQDRFSASVSLVSGWLPGSSTVSATASKEKAAQAMTARLDPSVRSGIQMTVAASISVVAGVLISSDRFYWAVLATFVTFMGANNAAEQVRKGAFRVIGTILGVIVGALLAEAVGQNVPVSIAVILVSLFLGIYLMRISYAFFAMSITILVAQLYVQLAELSAELLEMRVLETVVGAAAAVATVIFVLPLRTSRVVRVATREFLSALSALIAATVRGVRDGDGGHRLETASREVDVAFQALESATSPSRAMLRVPGTFGGVTQQWWSAANAAHSYARDLVADARWCTGIDGEAGARLDSATAAMTDSIAELSDSLSEHRSMRVYTRSASLFERVAADLDDHGRLTPRQLVLRDLQLIDGAVAALAVSAELQVRAVDTAVTGR